ncbi:uncharacterized protein LOC111619818 [Centruroides sculpturatus]|uniref:uncharacterized protein LOC111619818 n=1 Tax=Centruroides sculpturatus TaxID=218467 RepID=UPI000C6CC510|nr:uncharacterized protein LOC111619818 [Centruroides sculpturatus]
MFLIAVQYFHLEKRIQNRIIDFYKDPNENSEAIATRLLNCLQEYKLGLSNLSSISADNASVNYDKNKSVYKKLTDLNLRILKTREPAPTQPSYSIILKSGINVNISTKTKQPHVFSNNVLLVYSKDEKSNSDNLCKLLQKEIKPSVLKIGVNKIRKIAGRGVAVDLEKKEDIANLENCIKEKLPDVTTRLPKKRKPHVILYSVSNFETQDSLTHCIYNQNDLINETFSEEEFNNQFCVKFATGKKDAQYKNRVIEVSPKLRKCLLMIGKINIEWSRCRVGDFCPVLQCFRCCGYGHSSKECSQTKNTCSHCNQEHTFKECPNKNQ